MKHDVMTFFYNLSVKLLCRAFINLLLYYFIKCTRKSLLLFLPKIN